MKLVHSSLLALLALAPCLAAGDLVVKKQKHSDALKVRGMEESAKDSTETPWIGKDRLRSEDGN